MIVIQDLIILNNNKTTTEKAFPADKTSARKLLTVLQSHAIYPYRAQRGRIGGRKIDLYPILLKVLINFLFVNELLSTCTMKNK